MFHKIGNLDGAVKGDLDPRLLDLLRQHRDLTRQRLAISRQIEDVERQIQFVEQNTRRAVFPAVTVCSN